MSVWAIFIGDVIASFVYGLLISTVPVIIGLVFGVNMVNSLVLCLGVILAAFALHLSVFSCLLIRRQTFLQRL